jgi:hypothetical protein
MSSTNEDKGRLAMVWVEDGAGNTVRGHADSLTPKGARLLLPEDPGLTPGRDVALRLCLDRGAPILTVSARVRALRLEDEIVACDVEWKAGVESLLAAAA